jgi:hypothetical protein
VLESKVQTPAQVPPKIGSDRKSRKWFSNAVLKCSATQGLFTSLFTFCKNHNKVESAGKFKSRFHQGPKIARKIINNTDIKLQKRENSNPKLGVTINNMFLYQYKLQYQYKSYMTLTLTLRTLPSESKLIGRVQPTSTSTSRLTSGKALRSTLRLTLTLNNNNVYQFTIYITLTLRKTTSESKNIGRVQPTSTSRLTSGKALRSTLRLTLTPNNNNVYQFTIYITLTLRKMTSEINKESHKDPRNADKKCITLALSSTLRLTSGLAVRTTLRLTLNMTFNTNSIWCKISATLSSTETSNPTGEKKSMIKTTVARKT